MKIIDGSVFDYKNHLPTTIATFIILVVAILMKLWQGLFYRKIGKEISSVSLKANAQDSLNDVISTTVVLISMTVECILVYNGIFIQLDGWMGLVVSLFIVVMGIKMVIESSNPLIGEATDAKIVEKIIKSILEYPGVLGVHDMMCHTYGPTKIYMTIHVEVDYRNDIMKSHDLMDIIENEIQEKYGVLLTVHMDPIDNSSAQVVELKSIANNILHSYNNNLSLHDFRIVSGPTHTNILFDVVVPFETKIECEQLLNYIKKKFTEVNSNYFVIVKFDRVYIR
jgi:divalent metal cation (Fe/Co/Zn/Cd) transporter